MAHEKYSKKRPLFRSSSMDCLVLPSPAPSAANIWAVSKPQVRTFSGSSDSHAGRRASSAASPASRGGGRAAAQSAAKAKDDETKDVEGCLGKDAERRSAEQLWDEFQKLRHNHGTTAVLRKRGDDRLGEL